jgi:CheY-like chemotaxis protein
VKFTPQKGRIVVETGNPVPNEIEVRITDNGIGIDADKIDKIFNAFEQGQSSITRRFGGLGLGLAISKAMVDAHGGKIRVESPGKNKGATFSITLTTAGAHAATGEYPGGAQKEQADADIGAPQEVAVLPRVGATASDGDRAGNGASLEEMQLVAVPKEPAPAAHHRLLVVDDHQDTCTGMKLMLERRGYDITLAHSADQAVQKASTEKFDLLISDIGLPDRSGYDLMRELGKTKGLRGIALSGFGTEHDVNKARDAGFSEHLTKPINFDRLEEAIQNLLT